MTHKGAPAPRPPREPRNGREYSLLVPVLVTLLVLSAGALTAVVLYYHR